MLSQLSLELHVVLLIFAYRIQQYVQPIVAGVLVAYLPACDLFQHRSVCRHPIFHLRQAVSARVQHVCKKQHGQLTVAQPLPIGMRLPDGIYYFLYSHLLQPVYNQRYAVDTLDSLARHSSSPV